MQMGMVGLGKMGANMTERLVRGGHQVVGFDRNPAAVEAVVEAGAAGAASLEELISELSVPRLVWVMVPSGAATCSTLQSLAGVLKPGGVVVDGGNSFYMEQEGR